LRFEAGSRIISIYYEQNDVADGESSYLNKADLVAIAESLVSVDQAYRPDPALVNYTVEEGDTCTSIAEQFGTSVGSIARQNTLTDGCEFIYSGQNLLIPLTEERNILAESDLDCDGQFERLWIIPNPLSEDGGSVLGITVDKLTNLGLYQEVWHYTIAEAQARFFTWPQFYRTGECQHELAFNLILDSSNNARFEILRWDGESIIPANDGEAVSLPH
jgi:LysM repeat protein